VANSKLDDKPASALGDIVSVRRRLVVSFALAFALAFAWGPFCAFTHLLRTEQPTIFFSPSRYLFLTTVVCLTAGAVALVAAIPLIALIVFVWMRFGARTHRWFMFIGLMALGILAVHYLDVILPIVRIPGWAIRTLLIIQDLRWAMIVVVIGSVVSAYFNLHGFQISAFPLVSVFPLFALADILEPLAVVFTSAGLVYVGQRYIKADVTGDLIVEALGMMAFAAIGFAIALYVRVSHFVFALDTLYLLGFLGVLGLVVGVLLMAKRRA